MTIVLDPGHGGIDSGATNGNLYERDVNLKIANYLKSYLEQYEDVNIVMTHSGFSSGKLEIFDRAMVARNNKADLFVSLHINSGESAGLNGAEIYVSNNRSLEKYNKKTTELGNIILNNISQLGINNNGVKVRLIPKDETDIYTDGTRADYYGVIRYAMRGTMIDYGVTSVLQNGQKVPVDVSLSANVQNGEGIPTILIEHCYIIGNDVRFVNNEESIKQLAAADANGIIAYYNLQKKGSAKSKIVDNRLIVTPNVSLADLQKQYNGISSINIENQNFSTGAKIFMDQYEYTVVKLGDVNGDGLVDIIDMALIKRHINGTQLLNDIYMSAGLINKGDSITIIDMALIKRHLNNTQQISL